MTSKPLPPHGTYARARGNHRSGAERCHCQPCRAAEGAYAKRRKYLQTIGRPLLVDAAPVRAHLHQLHAAGDAYTHIADQIGLPRTTIANIVSGRNRRVRSSVAAALLAVRSGTAIAGNRSVPSIGSTRRIRALLALGHELNAVATASRIEVSTASYLLNGHVASIHYELAQRVDAGFRTLASSRGSSVRNLNRAQREGWAPPAAWDEDTIDDPAAAPDYGEQVPRYIALAEDCLELERQEFTREHIAERLGVTRDGLQRALSLYRQKTDMRKAA